MTNTMGHYFLDTQNINIDFRSKFAYVNLRRSVLYFQEMSVQEVVLYVQEVVPQLIQ